jgi:excisionase family DNA binding protein
LKNDSGVAHQTISVDGTVTQCVITIQFNPSPETNKSQSATEAPDGKLLLKINDAAERLSLSRTNIYKLLMNGELESIKIGRSRLIPTDALESFVDRHRSDKH